MAMKVRADRLPFETAVQTEQLYPTSQLLSSIIGCAVQPNKAIVGRNAFAHEAGIHQHGVISNPLCYEIMTPESVGVSKTSLIMGKHSGRAAFKAKLKTEPTWPKWTEFMAQKVEPAMGKLLDVPVFDPKKPVEGAFSCGKCHKLEAAKP